MEHEVAWVQCRELRTASYVSAALLLVAKRASAYANPTVPALTLNPKSAKRARLDESASHFPGIGVLSAK